MTDHTRGVLAVILGALLFATVLAFAQQNPTLPMGPGRVFPTTFTAASAGSLTPNCAFDVTKIVSSVTGNFPVNAPTGCNPVDGQTLRLKVTVPAGGNVSYVWNSIYTGSASIALPTTSIAVSTEDYFIFYYDADRTKYVYMGQNQGVP